jgi:hypothetical protein
MHLPQYDHADLGLVDDDNTEDMRKAPAATEAFAYEPNPNPQKEISSMTTLPADAALRQRHLKSAIGHILQAIAYTEGLAGRDGADVGQLYTDRGELKHIAETLDEMVGNYELEEVGK